MTKRKLLEIAKLCKNGGEFYQAIKNAQVPLELSIWFRNTYGGNGESPLDACNNVVLSLKVTA